MLCRATSGGFTNLGYSREVLFLRGYFQWSMSLRGGDIFAGRERCRSRRLDNIAISQVYTINI